MNRTLPRFFESTAGEGAAAGGAAGEGAAAASGATKTEPKFLTADEASRAFMAPSLT